MRVLEICLSFLVFCAVTRHINCDYYSSVKGLDKLLDVERHFMESLETHLAEVETLSGQLESFLDNVEHTQTQIENKTLQYFEHPVNAFKILNRLVVDWDQSLDLTLIIQSLNFFNQSMAFLSNPSTLPTVEDVKGAAKGLSRLQKIYNLESVNVSQGYLMDRKYSSVMTADDCFILGHSLYEVGEYMYASEWLIEALTKLEDIEEIGKADKDAIEAEVANGNTGAQGNSQVNEFKDDDEDGDEEDDEGNENDDKDIDFDDEDECDTIYKYDEFNEIDETFDPNEYPHVSAIEILEYLGASLYYTGNRKLASLMNSQLLSLDANNQYGQGNTLLFGNAIHYERRMQVVEPPPQTRHIEELYAKVCSGELQQTPKEKRNLRCRYVTNNVPFYFVGPLKMEELNVDPFAVQYHQVIYDSEMTQIIKAAEDSIERSQVGDGGDNHYDDVRTSKNTWLHYENTNLKFMPKISQRLEDITGLSMKSSEPLQVANYGIGGHYGPHHDFMQDLTCFGDKGNRILTALFYINDVEIGGATAFPVLHLKVPPIKGNLLVWYNMHKSLEGDYRTWHAGCPVLKGSKWISNAWFHTLGQEFTRPCGLEKDDEISKQYKNI